MCSPFAVILLLLPSFGFARPAQPISSLHLTPANLDTSNAIGPEPIDSRFEMLPVFQQIPLDEDQSLVIVVQLLGNIGVTGFLEHLPGHNQYWDDRLPNVLIKWRTPQPGTAIQAQFLIWGYYLGIKFMIENTRFRNANFILRWEGQVVCIASIVKKVPPRSLLSGANSTDFMQQRPSNPSNPSTVSASEHLNGTAFTLAMPATLSGQNSEAQLKITDWSGPLPKNNIILAVLDGILAMASRDATARIEDQISVQSPSPSAAILQIASRQMAPGQPALTFGMVSFLLKQVPGLLLLQKREWVGFRFLIRVDGVLVARGGLVQG